MTRVNGNESRSVHQQRWSRHYSKGSTLWLLWFLLLVPGLIPVGAAERYSSQSIATRVLYDADGQRVGNQVVQWDEVEQRCRTNLTRFLIDPQHPSGYAQRVAERVEDREGDRGYLYALHPIAEVATDRASYAVADGHHSVRGHVEDGGTFAKLHGYDAFGSPLADRAESSVAEGDREAVGYAGEFYDPATGLQDLRARQYEPGVGRFRTMDSYEGQRELPPGLHKFAYAEQDPVNRLDPTGHEMTAPSMSSVAGNIGTTARMTLPTVGRAFVHSRNLIGRSLVQATRLRLGDPTEYLMSRFLGAAISVGTVEMGLGLALAFDETEDNEGSGVLYRAMSGASVPDLLPDAEMRRSTFLGIRPSDAYVENGLALPFDRSIAPQGLSVTPDNPSKLPVHVLPKIAKGEVRVWGIYRRRLDPRLEYRPDPRRPTEHGLIGPRIALPLEEFKTLIRETQGQWSSLTQ